MNAMTGDVTLDYPQIVAEICAELTRLTQGRVEVGEDTDLLGDLGLDSLQVMNLMLEIEDRFDISIPVNILPDVKTVRDLAMQIDTLLRARSLMGLFDKFQGLAAARRRARDSSASIPSASRSSASSRRPRASFTGGAPCSPARTTTSASRSIPTASRRRKQALDTEGTGTTGSRMANGSYANHRKLERELAAFYEMRDAIVFSTGYQANLGLLSGLMGPNDVVLLDADCHASIYDGCRLAGAEVIRFRHNNVEDLAKRMRRLGRARGRHADRRSKASTACLGDRAPLREIVDVKRELGGYLLVDEAHSLGVLGERGRGLVEEMDVLADADFIVGTFSKSLGGAGGFCVSNLPALDLIRYSSRPYIFTASPSPATIASTRQALVKLAAGRELRARLRANYERLHAALEGMGYTLGAPPSPVIAVVLGERSEALQFWKRLVRARRLRQPDAAARHSERRIAHPLQRQRRAHGRADRRRLQRRSPTCGRRQESSPRSSAPALETGSRRRAP